MLYSLALVVLFGLVGNYIFNKINLPGILGMIIVGMAIGPFGFNILHKDLILVSGDYRKMALIIILLRAGLGLDKEELKKVGIVSFKMSCIPCLMEGFAIAIAGKYLLNISFIESGMLGFIIAAVSPAIVVPAMLSLKERNIGNDKNIPTMILASASIDDVFSITLFSMFMGLFGGEKINFILKIGSIPFSIVLGIVSGFFIGILIIWFFNRFNIENTKKILILLSVSILFNYFEIVIQNKISVASLLGVMTIGFIYADKNKISSIIISKYLEKIWTFAQILLFVLVGSSVNISVALGAGVVGFIIILVGLLFRSIGVLISTYKTDYSFKEKLFSIVAFLPKATVQAAMASVPLSKSVPSGEIILAIAVMSILLTAPLGAILIKKCEKLII